MKLSIIIVNYNTSDLLLDCLESLKDKVKFSHEIIVVDNKSSDLEIQKISSLKTIKLIASETNLGFGSANNLGVNNSTGEILWFLNPDTLIPDESINEALRYFGSRTDLGALSPLLFNDKDCQIFQEDMYADFQSIKSLVFRKIRPQLNTENEFFETDLVVGASLLIRREIFDRIQGFDENFFMFMEDDDLCYKARKIGCKNGVYTKAKIIHLKGKSIEKNYERKTMYYRSQDYFWRKHYGLLAQILMKILRAPYKIVKRHG